jgi:hypothetical protein
MFAWWKNARSDRSSEPLKASGKVRPSLAELTPLRLKSQGATEVVAEGTTEATTAPATDCSSNPPNSVRFGNKQNQSRPDLGSLRPKPGEELLELNWNWVLPKPLPATQNFDQDVVRVWSANAPPARREPTAREHAVELLQALQRQPCLVGKWVLSTDVELTVYPQLLACLGWAPRPWNGRNGVAKHLGNLTLRQCKRVEVAGATHNLAAYFVPGARTRVDGSTASTALLRRAAL